MLTSYPALDIYNPFIQGLRDAFEARYLPDGGLEAEESSVMRAYAKLGKVPYIADLSAGALAGRWGYGDTQLAVAQSLGIERTRLSDALHKGEMSIETYLSLRFSPDRPDDLKPSPPVLADMVRHGFMGAARKLAGRVGDRPDLHPSELDPLRHELLCALFSRFGTWTAEPTRRLELTLEVVEETCDEDRRSIVPNWYTKKEAKAVRNVVDSLTSSGSFARGFLADLLKNWADIYVATVHATEGKHWG